MLMPGGPFGYPARYYDLSGAGPNAKLGEDKVWLEYEGVSKTIDYPAGVITGVTPLILFVLRQSSGAAIDTPAGWTEQIQTTVRAPNLAIFRRECGAERTVTITHTAGAGEDMSVGLFVLKDTRAGAYLHDFVLTEDSGAADSSELTPVGNTPTDYNGTLELAIAYYFKAPIEPAQETTFTDNDVYEAFDKGTVRNILAIGTKNIDQGVTAGGRNVQRLENGLLHTATMTINPLFYDLVTTLFTTANVGPYNTPFNVNTKVLYDTLAVLNENEFGIRVAIQPVTASVFNSEPFSVNTSTVFESLQISDSDAFSVNTSTQFASAQILSAAEQFQVNQKVAFVAAQLLQIPGFEVIGQSNEIYRIVQASGQIMIYGKLDGSYYSIIF